MTRPRRRRPGPDPFGNQARGGAACDAWTGVHSDSALLDRDGQIAALHDAWDPQTGMRHAITWQAIQAPLEAHGPACAPGAKRGAG